MADEVARDVEALRGWTFKKPVQKAVATPEAAHRFIASSLERTLAPGRKAIMEGFLATAGLVPAGTDIAKATQQLLDDQVAGYYDPESQSLFVVDRGDMPGIVRRVVLAHELTHALDDQYGDIRSLSKPGTYETEDHDVVVSSLEEGSATALMMQYLVREQQAGRVNMAELMQYGAQEMERSKTLQSLPRYFSAMLGSYVIGAAFLAGGDVTALMLKEPDNHSVGERFLAARKQLPRSSEQMLHPDKYWDPAKRDEPMVVDDTSVERWLAAPGRFVVHRNTLGELLTAVLTQPASATPNLLAMQSSAAWTNAGAMGWGGDRFYLLASGASEAEAARTLTGLKGVWVTAWDTREDRDEFVQALAQGHPPAGAFTQPMGNQLAVVFIGFDAGEREALVKKAAAAPFPYTRDGKPWAY